MDLVVQGYLMFQWSTVKLLFRVTVINFRCGPFRHLDVFVDGLGLSIMDYFVDVFGIRSKDFLFWHWVSNLFADLLI